VFQRNYWYYTEVVWEVGGIITANLYADDGHTLLTTVTAQSSTYTEGGIAQRTFGDAYDPGKWDTWIRNSGPSPAEESSWGSIKSMFR
jgi:hypothetical protein